MRGSIRKRSAHSYELSAWTGFDISGKRKQEFRTVRGSRHEAERELRKWIDSIEGGGYVKPPKLTVEGFLRRWICHKRNSVSAKTLERYEEFCEQLLIPRLGNAPLRKLTPIMIQDQYAWMLREGRSRAKGGLSARTVLNCHRVLFGALRWAVKMRFIETNPAAAVDAPSPHRPEMLALDDRQVGQLLSAAQSTVIYIPTLLAVSTGMRRGEILALRWSDIDFDAAMLRVERTLQQTGHVLTFKDPKTPKSRRSIGVPAFALAALRRHRAAQNRTKLLLGPKYRDHDLVCPAPDGSPWAPDSMTSTFRSFIRRQKTLPCIRFHDLRHTHATQLLRLGVPLKVVSDRLGHTSAAITLDIYAHVQPGMQEDAMKRVQAAMAPFLKIESADTA